MAPDWIACHIYHRGDLDRLLVESLHPLTRELAETGAITSHFFVRYWNGGPHIRLRLLPSPSTDPGELIDRLQATVAQYRQVHPPTAADPDAYMREVVFMEAMHARLQERGRTLQPEIAEPLQPESVQLRPYTFEAERYGGPAARPISEALFAASSRLALSAVARTLDAPGKRLALACQLMAAFPRALGVAAQSAASLFSSQLAILSYLAPGQTTEEFMQHQGFAPYSEQISFLDAVLTEAGSSAYANAWQAELTAALHALDELQKQGLLEGRPADILASHVHMMNNRLGISTVRELYLHYLLANHFAQAAANRR